MKVILIVNVQIAHDSKDVFKKIEVDYDHIQPAKCVKDKNRGTF